MVSNQDVGQNPQPKVDTKVIETISNGDDKACYGMMKFSLVFEYRVRIAASHLSMGMKYEMDMSKRTVYSFHLWERKQTSMMTCKY